jgi:hypothetical protein
MLLFHTQCFQCWKGIKINPKYLTYLGVSQKSVSLVCREPKSLIPLNNRKEELISVQLINLITINFVVTQISR